MAKHLEIGKKGEFLAAQYLEKKGYQILEKNWRTGKLEIDIIASIQNQTIFVEVKSRSYNDVLSPELAVTKRKQRQVIKAADIWLKENVHECDARFDIISVLFNSKGHTISHIESAYYALAR